MKPVSIDRAWPVVTCFVRPFVSIQYVQLNLLFYVQAGLSTAPCHFQYLRSRFEVKFEAGW